MRRPFEFGDPSKAIDWKAYARTDKLYVHENAVQTQKQLLFFVDASDSMTWTPEEEMLKSKNSLPSLCSKFEVALRSILHLCHLAIELDDRVLGVVFFNQVGKTWHSRLISSEEVQGFFSHLVQCHFSVDQILSEVTIGPELSDLEIPLGTECVLFSDFLSDSHSRKLMNELELKFQNNSNFWVYHTLLSVERNPSLLSSKVLLSPSPEQGVESTGKPASFHRKFLEENQLLIQKIESWRTQLEQDCTDQRWGYQFIDELSHPEILYQRQIPTNV